MRKASSVAPPQELSNEVRGCWRVTPEELRKEAAATELMSRLVSFRPDKTWLAAKAAELRHQADKLEARSWTPNEPGRDPPAQ
ncbi:MAG: hypothetical protein JWQ97_2234 [Phenylobacterium sp.]|nr:hypothetical protein [Phenylobacterium sp.]